MAGVDILAQAFSGANAAYLGEQYARWATDPAAVDPSFADLFGAMDDDARAVLADVAGASWSAHETPQPAPDAPLRTNEQVRAATIASLRALMLIRSYRVRGHLEARLDPLGLQIPSPHAELDPLTYGFTSADLDRPIFIDNVLGRETATLREITRILRDTYCGSVGVEFMHIQDPDQKSWIQRRVEGAPWIGAFNAEEKRAILRQLTEAEGFEAFCQKRYVTTKRFGLEGGESAIPAMHAIIEIAAAAGVKEVAIGMPHRGRLNTLVNIVKKPLTALFSEFGGESFKPDDVQGSGDVKYHLGTSSDQDIAGHSVHLSLQPNPSHLEAVNPVVVGKVRARQDEAGDTQRRALVMAILMHGDAAFAGQGLVYETLAMSQLIGYRTGGTIHVIVNNQIGFTTVPAHAYSGLYCTDVAKSIQAPILHVNGDDLEAVIFCARMAAEFRMRFACDIVLDIVCYRRHGHNETDEPAFTQPIMYRAINNMKTTRTLYAERLAAEGIVPAAESQQMLNGYMKMLEDANAAAKSYKPNKADWLEGHWAGFHAEKEEEIEHTEGPTLVPEAALKHIGHALTQIPAGFDLNPKIARQLEAKQAMIDSGEGIDWATAEALAFGSLLLEGTRVRLSGEDCQRGTFSHRHAVLIDQTNQYEYVPLNNIQPEQAKIEIYNSLLSEAGVLGFEYGYSLADPRTLVLWEGQFGDFANGAQVIIDQFIASGETKWLRMSGLVMLLPHGYEGQGPEHSSARIERYLQLCAERNMWVCDITTPANYFHALRRQLHRNFRKPLIVFTPKSLLRHRLAVSPMSDMTDVQRFRFVLPEIDAIAPPERVRRVVLCSGKIYYDLLQERRAKQIDDIAIIRLEQLHPFPENTLGRVLKPYLNADVVWCQEEPENMGAWSFVDRRIERVLHRLEMKSYRPVYIGRDEAASPATGLAKTHMAQQARIVTTALGLG
jgi:2-oxoglutarate dehydrogenase E1 component